MQTSPPPPTTTTTPAPPSYPTPEQLKAQDDRFVSALDVLKDRASSQQTLIATITTLTGLYVVILSFAAYFRLQQTREESKEAVKANQKAFDDAKTDYTGRFDNIKDNLKDFETTTRSQITELQSESRTKVNALITEVRTDIPALHGIGRRLEQLLAELDSRLPVDGDWTTAATYDKLPTTPKNRRSSTRWSSTRSTSSTSPRTSAPVAPSLASTFASASSTSPALTHSSAHSLTSRKTTSPLTVHPDDP